MHGLSGLLAAGAGLVATRTRKGARPHRRAGLIYLGALLSLALTTRMLVVGDWSQRWHLAVIAVVALGFATVGYTARLRRNVGWQTAHIGGMAASYMAMLTAFYVDNGPHGCKPHGPHRCATTTRSSSDRCVSAGFIIEPPPAMPKSLHS